VCYSGLLANSGADRIYAHVGYGMGKWSGIQDVEMRRQGEQFITSVKMEAADMFNLCFKDSASNWDNNNGNNWSTKVSGRRY
jgi:hypothetical protein